VPADVRVRLPGILRRADALVRGYNHFLALLGWCDILAARRIEELCAGPAGTGLDIAVEVAGGKLMSAFVRAVES